MGVTKGFKRLDLIEFLKNYGQRFTTLHRRCKTITKKAKWLSEESLQKAEKRRQEKAKERERYTEFQMNAELQRIAKRDKKDLSEQMQRKRGK